MKRSQEYCETPSEARSECDGRLSQYTQEESQNSVTRRMQQGNLATPGKHRFNLGVASSYYFADVSKTPLSKKKASVKKSNLIHENELILPISNEIIRTDVTGPPQSPKINFKAAIEKSLKHVLDDSNRSLSDDDNDVMNKSVLSDTTELTASNFVLMANSRQNNSEKFRSLLGSYENHLNKEEIILKSRDPDIEKENDFNSENVFTNKNEALIELKKASNLVEIVKHKDAASENKNSVGEVAFRNENRINLAPSRKSFESNAGNLRFGSMSPGNLGDLISNMKKQRHKRESLAQLERVRRFSSSSDNLDRRNSFSQVESQKGIKSVEYDVDASSPKSAGESSKSNVNNQSLSAQSITKKLSSDETADYSTQLDLFDDLFSDTGSKRRETVTGDIGAYFVNIATDIPFHEESPTKSPLEKIEQDNTENISAQLGFLTSHTSYSKQYGAQYDSPDSGKCITLPNEDIANNLSLPVTYSHQSSKSKESEISTRQLTTYHGNIGNMDHDDQTAMSLGDLFEVSSVASLLNKATKIDGKVSTTMSFAGSPLANTSGKHKGADETRTTFSDYEDATPQLKKATRVNVESCEKNNVDSLPRHLILNAPRQSPVDSPATKTMGSLSARKSFDSPATNTRSASRGRNLLDQVTRSQEKLKSTSASNMAALGGRDDGASFLRKGAAKSPYDSEGVSSNASNKSRQSQKKPSARKRHAFGERSPDDVGKISSEKPEPKHTDADNYIETLPTDSRPGQLFLSFDSPYRNTRSAKTHESLSHPLFGSSESKAKHHQNSTVKDASLILCNREETPETTTGSFGNLFHDIVDLRQSVTKAKSKEHTFPAASCTDSNQENLLSLSSNNKGGTSFLSSRGIDFIPKESKLAAPRFNLFDSPARNTRSAMKNQQQSVDTTLKSPVLLQNAEIAQMGTAEHKIDLKIGDQNKNSRLSQSVDQCNSAKSKYAVTPPAITIGNAEEQNMHASGHDSDSRRLKLLNSFDSPARNTRSARKTRQASDDIGEGSNWTESTIELNQGGKCNKNLHSDSNSTASSGFLNSNSMISNNIATNERDKTNNDGYGGTSESLSSNQRERHDFQLNLYSILSSEMSEGTGSLLVSPIAVKNFRNRNAGVCHDTSINLEDMSTTSSVEDKRRSQSMTSPYPIFLNLEAEPRKRMLADSPEDRESELKRRKSITSNGDSTASIGDLLNDMSTTTGDSILPQKRDLDGCMNRKQEVSDVYNTGAVLRSSKKKTGQSELNPNNVNLLSAEKRAKRLESLQDTLSVISKNEPSRLSYRQSNHSPESFVSDGSGVSCRQEAASGSDHLRSTNDPGDKIRSPSTATGVNPQSGAADNQTRQNNDEIHDNDDCLLEANTANRHLTDSPARNTRSRTKASNEVPGKLVLNLENSGKSIGLAEEVGHQSHLENTFEIEMSLTSSKSILNSSFRQRGRPDSFKGGRKVVFGSPEFAEFNKGSPSINFTPIPSAGHRRRKPLTLTENTQEIAADMDALLKSVENPSKGATGVVGNVTVSSPSTHSDMSVDSADSATEMTLRLEHSMTDLLDRPGGYTTPPSSVRESNLSNNDENTMELEPDLATLLNANYNASSVNRESSNHRYQHESASDHGFSLIEANHPSLFADQICKGDTSNAEDQNVSLTADTQLVKMDELTMKVRDLFPGMDMLDMSSANELDLLCTLGPAFLQLNVFELLLPWFKQVLKVVNDDAGDDMDLDNDVVAAVGYNDAYLAIQQVIRSDNRNQMDLELYELREKLCLLEVHNFHVWLTSVVNTINTGFDRNLEELESQLLGTEAHLLVSIDAIRLIQYKSARKREWLQRTKENEIARVRLVDEIAYLEDEISRTSSCLELSNDELSTVELLRNEWESHELIQAETLHQRDATASAERKVTSLGTFRILRPAAMSSSKMVFSLLGPCPEACISISCTTSTSGIVTFSAKTEPSLFSSTRKSILTKSNHILKYIEAQAMELSSFVRETRLKHPTCIGPFLREVEWTYGRSLELAAEIAIVGRRYKTILSPIKDSPSDFMLVIDFGLKLRAQFRISNKKLFLHVSVDFKDTENDPSVESLEKVLKKTANPGIGYLAHTCDIISASIH